MFYRTQPNTPTHLALRKLFDEISASRKAIRDWVEAQGATEYMSYSYNLSDRPVALLFPSDSVPEGWKYSKKYAAYMPDTRSALGKSISSQIAALPIVGRMRLTDVLQFQPYTRAQGGSFGICSHPSVTDKGNMFLIEYNSDYTGTIPKDLEEIKGSIFNDLKKQEKPHDLQLATHD